MLLIDADNIKTLLDYNPTSGVFTWKVNTGRSRNGKVAGYIRTDGYISIGYKGHSYLAHRLAFLYMSGSLPVDEVDHINNNRQDNSFKNLRQVNSKQNKENRKSANSNSSHGFLGVTKNHSRYMAHICNNKRSLYLGTYDTPEEAQEAYLKAKRELHKGNTL